MNYFLRENVVIKVYNNLDKRVLKNNNYKIWEIKYKYIINYREKFNKSSFFHVIYYDMMEYWLITWGVQSLKFELPNLKYIGFYVNEFRFGSKLK